MRKPYWKHLVNTQKIPLIFFFVVIISISLLMVAGHMYPSTMYKGNMYMMLALAFTLPIYLLHWVHSKKSTDVYMALPYSKKEIIVGTIGISWVVCMIYLLAISVLPVIYDLTQYGHIINFLFYFGVTALGTIVLLLVNTAIFVIANNLIDGLILIFAYHLLPIMAEMGTMAFFNSIVAGNTFSFEFSEYTPLVAIFRVSEWYHMYHIVTLIVEGLIAIYLINRHFIHRKSERAEQLTTSILGYPFLISIYTILVLLMIFADSITTSSSWFFQPLLWLLILFVFTCNLMGQFIYKRMIKPNWAMVIRFGIIFVATLAVTITGWQTKGFGLAMAPIKVKDGDILEYYYSTYDYRVVDDKDTYEHVSISFNTNFDPTDPKYKEFYDLMEKRRIDSIKAFYQRNVAGGTYFSIRVLNPDPNHINSSSYYRTHAYSLPYDKDLSNDELKMIDKLTPIKISYVDNQTDEWQELSLDEYLKNIGK